MSRFYLRVSFIPIALFTAVLLVIHAQPYDDHELRQLLLPEGCPAPCFLGIRPGITTMDEAFKILQASEWVNHIEKASVIFNDDIINWTWSDQKPKWIGSSSQNQIWAPQYSEKPIVGIITVYSSIQIGEIRLVLGLPDSEWIVAQGNWNDNYFRYFADYANKSLTFQSKLPCGVTDIYRSVVVFGVGTRLGSDYSKPVNILSDVFHAC